ncbi:MAG: hypothetical protein ACOCSR_01270, partial [Wenzhouxiangella sp.]
MAEVAGSQAPEPAGDRDCRYAGVQPEDLDFDEPGERLGRQVDLEIPEAARIGEIVIDRREVFSPDREDEHWLPRWGNRLHVLTRENALRAQLFFEPGDAYRESELEESERVLRGQDYLLDAWVQPFRVCGERVDVAVVTRDLWTLRPDFGFTRTGGENRTSIGFTDENFLGTGKRIAVKRQTGPERDRTLIDYADPNILGSRWRGAARIADNSDGDEQWLDIERPFYRFGTRWAAGFDARRDDRVDEFFERGDEVSAFRHELTTTGAFGGLSLGVRDRIDRRLLFGYRHVERDFSVEPGELPPPTPFPDDRTLSYPWIGFALIENRFVETVNLDRIQRIEDVRDGIEFETRLGWSDSALGGDADRLVVATRLRDALFAESGRYLEYRIEQD